MGIHGGLDGVHLRGSKPSHRSREHACQHRSNIADGQYCWPRFRDALPRVAGLVSRDGDDADHLCKARLYRADSVHHSIPVRRPYFVFRVPLALAVAGSISRTHRCRPVPAPDHSAPRRISCCWLDVVSIRRAAYPSTGAEFAPCGRVGDSNRCRLHFLRRSLVESGLAAKVACVSSASRCRPGRAEPARGRVHAPSRWNKAIAWRLLPAWRPGRYTAARSNALG